ncbi:MAG: ribbon-helix-helix protein, CopG family [Acidobacteria bacterium]|nr:ribbon-helix-helix protein, CopG family [Acidobacteriota bacterium]
MVAQIELTDEQAEALDKLAASRGQSVSELILSGVAALLRQEPAHDRDDLRQRALELSGRFRSGLTDFSIEHDRYLEEAFSD